MTRRPIPFWVPIPVWVPVLILFLTIVQLAVAEWWPGIDRFAGKAFGARLVAYRC